MSRLIFLSLSLLVLMASAPLPAYASGLEEEEVFYPEDNAALTRDRYAAECVPTPYLSREPYPGAKSVTPSSKLARPGGKSLFAPGQLLYVRGRVFDAACVPLKDAKVELWQTNAEGQYRYADAGDLSNPYATFAGAGRAVTDNRGEYLFETIFPAPEKDQTPYLNLRITHPSLKTPLLTTLYFDGDMRNESDKRYRAMKEAVRARLSAPVVPYDAQDVNSGLMVFFDITVSSRDGFRQF